MAVEEGQLLSTVQVLEVLVLKLVRSLLAEQEGRS